MNVHSKVVVTSAEFTRQFGQLRQSPGRDPVFVTHHGRETHVLLTISGYQELQAKLLGHDNGLLAQPSGGELANRIQQALVVLDQHRDIILANGVAHAMLGRDEGDLVGRNWEIALPELEGSLAQGYINRAINAREIASADLPSVIREGAWVRLEVYPSARNTTILVRDITEDVRTHRLADAKKAIVEAMSLHGGIGYIRTNARGRIACIDKPMCDMLKLPEERLIDVAVPDLVPLPKRAPFRESLEQVLCGSGPVRIETDFLANDGNAVSLNGAITELRGVYGSEGAVLILTQLP